MNELLKTKIGNLIDDRQSEIGKLENTQTDFLTNVNNTIQNMSSDDINKIISNLNIINGVDTGVNDVKAQKKIFNIEKTKKKY